MNTDMNFLSVLRTFALALSAVAILLFGLPAFAQQAEVLSQQRLSRWGIDGHDFSGIAPLVGGRYAVVSDKVPARGFFVLRIEQDSITGAVIRVANEGFLRDSLAPSFAIPPDCEGVAVDPGERRVWIADESTQQISAHTYDARWTGNVLRTSIGTSLPRIFPNLGFEALAFDGARRLLWTTTESPTRDDAPSAPPLPEGVPTVVRLQAYVPGGDLVRSIAYRLDDTGTPHAPRVYLHGVPSLCALSSGRLLVMERELIVPRRFFGAQCAVRLYLVCPDDYPLTVEALPDAAPIRKRRLAEWTTRLRLLRSDLTNYEGMCLGRRLADGRQTLLCIGDAQSGAGRALWHLHDRLRVVVLPQGL